MQEISPEKNMRKKKKKTHADCPHPPLTILINFPMTSSLK